MGIGVMANFMDKVTNFLGLGSEDNDEAIDAVMPEEREEQRPSFTPARKIKWLTFTQPHSLKWLSFSRQLIRTRRKLPTI